MEVFVPGQSRLLLCSRLALIRMKGEVASYESVYVCLPSRPLDVLKRISLDSPLGAPGRLPLSRVGDLF